jgi:hypothetical protein
VDIDDENQGRNEGVENGRDSKGAKGRKMNGMMCDAATIVGRLSSPARRRR